MARGIFVSYRRDDARQAAGRLADNLAEAFGAERIFRDIETIELGVDFAKALHQALNSCVVMLVLIGRNWLDVRGADGTRRLDDPKDWIRQEIVSALQRDIRVVPVLVDGAALPDEKDLPDDLKSLVRRQALELDDSRWKGDLQRLEAMLSKLPGLEPLPAAPPVPAAAPPAASVPARPNRKKWWIWAGVAALVIIGAIESEYDNGGGDAVAPFVSPPPAAPGPAPAPLAGTPNLSGPWRSADGAESYQFSQNGTQVQIAAFMRGANVGGGSGELQGQLLRVNLSLQMQGVHMANARCELQLSPDLRALTGLCAGPNGQYPVQLFR